MAAVGTRCSVTPLARPVTAPTACEAGQRAGMEPARPLLMRHRMQSVWPVSRQMCRPTGLRGVLQHV